MNNVLNLIHPTQPPVFSGLRKIYSENVWYTSPTKLRRNISTSSLFDLHHPLPQPSLNYQLPLFRGPKCSPRKGFSKLLTFQAPTHTVNCSLPFKYLEAKGSRSFVKFWYIEQKFTESIAISILGTAQKAWTCTVLASNLPHRMKNPIYKYHSLQTYELASLLHRTAKILRDIKGAEKEYWLLCQNSICGFQMRNQLPSD